MQQFKLIFSLVLLSGLIACNDSDPIKPLQNNNLQNLNNSVADGKAKTNQQATGMMKKWSTVSGQLNVPESVIFDPQKRIFYVSNINSLASGEHWQDNSGFISTLDIDGKIIQTHWVDGLQAPKGMVLSGSRLFVADLDEVLEIDTETGAIAQRFTAPEDVISLNDISYDEGSERLFVSDYFNKRIYQIDSKGNYALFYDTEKNNPYQNGLYVDDGQLIMAGQQGKIKALDIQNGNVIEIAEGIDGSIDGIWKYNDKGYLVSVWEGSVYYVGKNGKVVELLNTQPVNTADTAYWPEKDWLLIPDFDQNVSVYEVNLPVMP